MSRLLLISGKPGCPPKRTRLQSTSRLWSFVPLDIWELVIPVCLFVATLQYVTPARQPALSPHLHSLFLPFPNSTFFLPFLPDSSLGPLGPSFLDKPTARSSAHSLHSLSPSPFLPPFQAEAAHSDGSRWSILLLPERYCPLLLLHLCVKTHLLQGLCGSAFMSHSILLLIPFPLRKMWFLAQPAEMH